MNLMNEVFGKYQNKFIKAFFDDIIIEKIMNKTEG